MSANDPKRTSDLPKQVVPCAVGRWYHFHEFGRHLGSVELSGALVRQTKLATVHGLVLVAWFLLVSAVPGRQAHAHGEGNTTTVMQTLNLCMRGGGQFNERHSVRCNAILRSVRDTYEWVAAQNSDLKLFCIPDEVELKESREEFVNWARKNPKEWQKPDVFGAIAAWSEAYPCE